SRINAVASDVAIPVEPRLFGLLERSLELSRATHGAMDITAAPLAELWRSAREMERIPTMEEIARVRRSVGYQYVELDPDRRTIRFTRPGMRIDLGCIGKGFALDETSRILTEAGIRNFLYHGGFSSILARGSKDDGPISVAESSTATMEPSGTSGTESGPAEFSTVSGEAVSGDTEKKSFVATGSGWTVGLRDPDHPERRLAKLRLRNRALGTSGSQIRFFRYRGRRYGHLLDPRTGWPPQTNRAVTVVAPDATLADGLSTAFYVLSSEEIVTFCEEHAEQYPGLSVLLVDTDVESGHEIMTYGFGPEDLVSES
ncbi:MAG: FAD:protein FMN transferase, partial [Planctomycetia bacterium]|nr:FAD:protein FMN transferase [Planctomycetia bacterium]